MLLMRRAIAAIMLAAAFGSHFAVVGFGDDLAFQLPEGMRAVSIGGSALLGGTRVEPGDKVDLWATYDDPRTTQKLTKVIVQNVMVLALDNRHADTFGKTNNWIVLMAKAEQVGLIEAVDRAGTLKVSLRMRFADQQILPDEEVMERGFGHWRNLGLKYLKERYPNIEARRFGFHMEITQPNGDVIVVFFDRDSRKQSVNKPEIKEEATLVTYGTQYSVRLNHDGKLIDIQRQDRYDGILKISPAPSDKIIPTSPTIIIEPDHVPRSP